jgi:adenosylhomocysteinase
LIEAGGLVRGSDRASRIEWVVRQCRLLNSIGDEFERTRPFGGLTIGTGIHLEAKGVALMLVLQRGGARVISTGNLNSTQPGALDYLRDQGVETVGGPTQSVDERLGWIDEILAEKPDLLLDNGGDMFVRWLDRPYDGLRGGTEETTSGRICSRRCVTASACRSSSSMTARSSSSRRTGTRSGRARSSRSCA